MIRSKEMMRLGMLGVLGLVFWGVACEPTPSGQDGAKSEVRVEPAVVEQSIEPSQSSDAGVADAKPYERTPRERGPDLALTDKPYTIVLFDRETIHSTGQVNVRNISKKFRFRNKTFANLVLHIQLESPCYPFEKWEKPPPGQRWPANCDAFDRNMDVTWNPATQKGDPPGFDLVRIITPFGGPLSTTVNLTYLGNALAQKYPPGYEHTMKIHISTWSDAKGQVSGSAGSWIVSARLEVTPGPPPRKVLAAYSLFNHSYKHNDGAKETAVFTTPAGTKSVLISYLATGHGGGAPDSACIGHADEFCKRTHRLFADGKQILQVIPWRTDCAKLCTEVPLPQNPGRTYCKENPMGDKRSVRAPRANWCPGSITQPIFQTVDAFAKPGKHTFSYSIEKVAKGGSWRVSAIAYLYGD